jgi:hypothetical protein
MHLIVYFFDSLGPNLFISSRTPIIASGNKIAAIVLVVFGLTIYNIICRPPYYFLWFYMQFSLVIPSN